MVLQYIMVYIPDVYLPCTVVLRLFLEKQAAYITILIVLLHWFTPSKLHV